MTIPALANEPCVLFSSWKIKERKPSEALPDMPFVWLSLYRAWIEEPESTAHKDFRRIQQM
jgi:hypothetical protein